jgi:hypothetical protein
VTPHADVSQTPLPERLSQGSPQVEALMPTEEAHVVVAGDWHGNSNWVGTAIPSIARLAPGVKTILHLGDFGIGPGLRARKFLDSVDYWSAKAGISRVLVTPGNHEDWAWLEDAFAARPGYPVPLSSIVEALPRGYRFEIGPRSFVSFGGAASVDYEMRLAGVDWFSAEMPTQEDVDLAIRGGAADVLLTHETVDGGTSATEMILSRNPLGFSPDALEYSRQSRALVTQVWRDISPTLLFHGHMHVADEITLPSGQQVISLGRDGQTRNLGLLELATLGWQWLEDAPVAATVRRTRDWETQFLNRPED